MKNFMRIIGAFVAGMLVSALIFIVSTYMFARLNAGTTGLFLAALLAIAAGSVVNIRLLDQLKRNIFKIISTEAALLLGVVGLLTWAAISVLDKVGPDITNSFLQSLSSATPPTHSDINKITAELKKLNTLSALNKYYSETGPANTNELYAPKATMLDCYKLVNDQTATFQSLNKDFMANHWAAQFNMQIVLSMLSAGQLDGIEYYYRPNGGNGIEYRSDPTFFKLSSTPASPFNDQDQCAAKALGQGMTPGTSILELSTDLN